MILALVGHAWVGMWTVLTDYVKSNGLRFVLQSAMILAVLVYLFWGVMIFF
jgi:succinate dehydrogenase / fumarate reductase membrane anchor subunit